MSTAMADLAIPLPPTAVDPLDRSSDEFVRELRFAAATYLYHRVEVSRERAAEIAGLSRLAFLNELARRELDVIVVDLDDLDRELAQP